MLKRALDYRVAVNRFGSTEPDYTWKLTDREWESVENMASILQPFYEMTNLFLGQITPLQIYILNKFVRQNTTYDVLVKVRILALEGWQMRCLRSWRNIRVSPL